MHAVCIYPALKLLKHLKRLLSAPGGISCQQLISNTSKR